MLGDLIQTFMLFINKMVPSHGMENLDIQKHMVFAYHIIVDVLHCIPLYPDPI